MQDQTSSAPVMSGSVNLSDDNLVEMNTITRKSKLSNQKPDSSLTDSRSSFKISKNKNKTESKKKISLVADLTKEDEGVNFLKGKLEGLDINNKKVGFLNLRTIKFNHFLYYFFN